jgi:hypothetical protein
MNTVGEEAWHCFEQAPRDEPGVPQLVGERLLHDQPATPLVCAACAHPITRADARIAVDGAHEHTEVNPTGWVYRFGCFTDAPGCRADGVPSKQATWFAGHWWYRQACAGCGEHLGWLFFSDAPDSESFYGLILDRLVEPGVRADA